MYRPRFPFFASDYKPHIKYFCVGVFTDDSITIHAGHFLQVFPRAFRFHDGTTYPLASKSATRDVLLRNSVTSATSNNDDAVLLIS